MPNWVRNKVRFSGDKARINALKRFVKGKETEFDFNKIVPMPDELNIGAGSDETIAKDCALARRAGKTTSEELNRPWANKMSFDEWADLGDIYLNNIKKYGASTWYDWSCNNWGTKWNAHEVCWERNDFVVFETAWSAPEPIFIALSEKFPDVTFSVEFADEDLGNNCGTIDYDGETVTTIYSDDFEFACDVWDYDADEMREEYGME